MCVNFLYKGFKNLFAVVLISAFFAAPFAKAEESDFNISPNQIQFRQSVPQIGTDPHTGAAVYELPIHIPPGRNGVEPSLSLIYSSNDTNNTNTLGYGWSTSIPSITRLNKEGTNNLYTEKDYTSSLDGELVYINTSGSKETYRARFDNGSFNLYELENNSWTVTAKDGTVHKFGSSAANRQDDPNDSTKVYRWMINETRDTNDNYVSYEYYKDAGQIYPLKIKYTGNGSTDGLFEIEFLRESRADNLLSYQPAFNVASNYRINEIQVKENGTWVRKYALAYTAGDNGNRSLLSSVTESGKDESSNITTLPAVSFTYQTASVSWATDSNWSIPIDFIDSELNPAHGVRYSDINGDGLVDILRAHDTGSGCTVESALNTGSKWENGGATVPEPACFLDDNGPTYNDFGLRIGDVDGDGISDLVMARDVDHQDNTPNEDKTYKKVYLGTRSTFATSTAYNIPDGFGFSSWYSGGTLNTLTDINADGRTDIFNGGSVFYSGDTITGWDTGTSVGTTTFAFDGRFGDFNGDGLLDTAEHFLEQRPGPDVTYERSHFNTGDGFASTGWTLPFLFNSNYNDMGARFTDVNADGLTDIVRAHKNNSGVKTQTVYINNGSGWASSSITVPTEVIFTNNTFSGEKDAGWRAVDINGDGLVDFAGTYYDNSVLTDKVYINQGNKPDILSTVTTQDGATVTYGYKTSYEYTDGNGDLLNTDAPFPVTVVNSMSTNDGFGNTDTKTYSYEGVDYYFSSYDDRQFTGFHKVTETDNDGNKTKVYYHQGNTTDSANGEHSDHVSKNGRAYRTEVYDSSDNLMAVTVDKWEHTDLGGSRYLVTNTGTTDITYDGDADKKAKATTRVYSSTNGNVTSIVEYGEVSANTDGSFTDTGTDKRTTTITYATDSSGVILNKPKEETRTNYSSEVVGKTKRYYDSQAHGTVTVGNETKTEELLSGSTYATTDRTYNSYGLVTLVDNPRGYDTTYAYDSYNLYPATITNHLNHVTTYLYDYSSGKEKKVTDPNGYVVETTYDGLDRPLTIKGSNPASPASLIDLKSFTYTDTSGAKSIHERTYHTGTVYTDTYTYFDGLDRPIQTRASAEDNKYVVTDTVYTRDNLVQKASLPYFGTGTGRTTVTTNSDLFTTYTYDALDRTKTETTVVGTTLTAYDDWMQTVTDTESNSKDYTYGAFGNLKSVVEREGVSSYTTSYEYDANNNLTKLTDAAGNIRNFTYDNIGNRLTAEDLHAPADATFGTWTYTYDANANLASQVDPKSQTTNFTYDALDRVTTEDYTGAGGTEKTYTYDTGAYGKGRLTSAVNGSVTTAYAYEVTGDVDTETRTVSSTNYVTTYNYNRQHKPTNITYPDNAEVRYTYNVTGEAEKIEHKEGGGSFVDAVTDIDYGSHGRIVYKDYGNNVVSYYTYDPAELYRLKNITTIDPEDEVVEEVLAEEPEVITETIEEVPVEVVEESIEDTTVIETTGETATSTEAVVEEVVEEDTTTAETAAQAQEEVAITTEVTSNQLVEESTNEITEEVIINEDIDTASETQKSESKPILVAEEVVAEEVIEELVHNEESVDTTEAQQSRSVLIDNHTAITTLAKLSGGEKELEDKRTEHSYSVKVGTTEEGNDIIKTSLFTNPIHYESQGKFIPIDTRFREDDSDYLVNHASYTLRLPKVTNLVFGTFSVGNLDVQISLVKKRNGDLIGEKSRSGSKKDRKARYSDLLGNGIDIEMIAENDYVKKDIVIKNKKALQLLHKKKKHYEITFKVKAIDADVYVNEELLTENAQETRDPIRIEKGNDVVFIWPSVVKDADGDVQIIPVRYKKTKNGFTLTKRMPVEWAKSASFPIRTDAIVSDYAGSADGYVYIIWGSSWSSTRDASSGTEAVYSPHAHVYASSLSFDNEYGMERAYLPFDTSGIPSEAEITDATLKLYMKGVYDNYNDSNAYIAVTESTQQSTSYLSTDDYSAFTDVKGSADYDISALSNNQYQDFVLNSTGIGWIDRSGWTTLAVREGHDIDDTPINGMTKHWNRSGIEFYSSEQAGIDKDPYLEVTYSVSQPPSEPTLLQAEETTNPSEVIDITPEFTAIFNDPNTGDFATDYQLQVATDAAFSNIYWDGAKTALNATTTIGARSEDLVYAGPVIPQDGTTYYWRVKFWDNEDAEGVWSTENATFTMTTQTIGQFEPTNLYASCIEAQSGSTNPLELRCGSPVFSAVHTDPASSSANKFRMQVSTSSDFATGMLWDSTSTGIQMADVANNARSNDIVYSGTPLEYDGTEYHWRVKFWDTSGTEGMWSAPGTFTTYTSEIFQDVHYTYDSVGNIVKIVDSSDTSSAKTVDYTYDDLYRLTAASSTLAATSTDYALTYAYDSIGNFTNKSDIGSYSYSGTGKANPHAATTVGSATYTYDDNGNLTDDGTRTYTWNYDNTAATVVKSGTTYTHTYDHDGQRVKTDDGTTTTTFANRYYETDGTNTTKYIYAGDELVATIEDDTTNVDTWYVHPDHLKSTAVLTNASSTEAQALDYYPFGATRVDDDTDGVGVAKQYIGEYKDESDLSYLSARYYDGAIGRFTAQDPVFLSVGAPESRKTLSRVNGSPNAPIIYSEQERDKDKKILETFLADPQLQNAYSYSRSNPINWKDPNGEFGVFLQADASANVGVFSGFAGSASAGTGVVFGNSRSQPIDFGGYASYGGLAGGSFHSTTIEGSASDPNNSGVFGFSAGLSGGVTLTNATRLSQLGGISQTNNFSFGIGSVSWSNASGIWTFTAALGLESALSFSSYPTDTKTGTLLTTEKKSNSN